MSELFVPLGDALKVGILPFVVKPDGSRHYMIYQPKNKNLLDAPQPFQLARGTPEPEDDGNALQTAKREAWEELAVYPEEVCEWIDAGAHIYKDYKIHFFLARLVTCISRQPEDALATRWVDAANILDMSQNGTFKHEYLPLFHAMSNLS